MILIGLPKGRIYKEIRQLLENSGIHLKEDKRKWNDNNDAKFDIYFQG